jgi:hypothetical protein
MHAHTRAHTHTHTRTHTRAHTHAHTYTRTRAHTRTHTHTHIHKRTHARRHTRTHTRTHAHTHTHMYKRAQSTQVASSQRKRLRQLFSIACDASPYLSLLRLAILQACTDATIAKIVHTGPCCRPLYKRQSCTVAYFTIVSNGTNFMLVLGSRTEMIR